MPKATVRILCKCVSMMTTVDKFISNIVNVSLVIIKIPVYKFAFITGGKSSHKHFLHIYQSFAFNFGHTTITHQPYRL